MINYRMPYFAYEAVDSSGKKVRASLEAQDESSVKKLLRERQLTPIKIKPVHARKPFSFKRATRKDLLNFTSELGSLLNAGLPIDRAFYVLSTSVEKEQMRDMLKDIYVDIQKGRSLSQALSKHKLFPEVYINTIKAGETGGILEQVIKRLSDFLEITAAFKNEIISALIYPALLFSVGGLAIGVLVFFVIPKFYAIFADMGQQLPASTMLLMKLSAIVTGYWWAGLIVSVAVVFSLAAYMKTPDGKVKIASAILRIPVLNGLGMKFSVANFSRTLGTLLQSGVPVLEAVKISREVIGNAAISMRLLPLEEGIKKGRGVAGPLRETSVFPSTVNEMITVGEEAGKLEETFLIIAERFEAESRAVLKRAISLIEPTLILVMGLIVGFIVISMLLAVFSMNDMQF